MYNKYCELYVNRRDTHLPCRVACMAKSPVLLQRLPRVACIELGRGDGDGAGDTELLLGESECSEPLDWWIILVRLRIEIWGLCGVN